MAYVATHFLLATCVFSFLADLPSLRVVSGSPLPRLLPLTRETPHSEGDTEANVKDVAYRLR
jgi:hypothetical protein